MKNRSAFEAMRPLIDELRGLGFDVETLADLRHQPRDYSEAVPVLLYWLSKVEDRVVKEEIVRCLTLKKAPPIVSATLIREFLNSDDRFLKWAIGNALCAVGDESNLPEMLAIAEDQRHRTARQMIVMGLARFPEEPVYKTLLRLLGDPDVCGHAVIALGKLGYGPARDKIVPFLSHEKAWIRRKTKSAIASIDKKIVRGQEARKHERKQERKQERKSH
jgi:HEAT repeat protein